MAKCLGCGATLQIEDPQKIGYVSKKGQEYCRRCFRLRNYNDLTLDVRNKLDYDDLSVLLEEEKEALVCIVLDILSLTSFIKANYLNRFKDHKFIILINKFDLLPYSINEEKIINNIQEILKKEMVNNTNFLTAFICSKNDKNFKEMFYEFVDEYQFNKFIFVGDFNAGKSSLINLLTDSKELTSSMYPGSSINVNKKEYLNYIFYDSPGLENKGNIYMHIPSSKISLLKYNYAIKPITYQINSKQSFIFDGLFILSVEGKGGSVIFYLPDTLNILRTKKDNLENYLSKHQKEFNFNLNLDTGYEFAKIDKKEYEISGLGFVRLVNIEKADFILEKNVGIYEREILI